ncbi:PUA-like domain-containing protein [Jimgerdemannia flammicorona]|uniref:PUA-like domain-containing protein n=1 Tax=Jimgerdemannia flammicorona TaxID=994334 RepID=A0A433Q5U1_9FUNG|nr:PUA-like domain-containing protein [Jimgerdemannia flammicorona]
MIQSKQAEAPHTPVQEMKLVYDAHNPNPTHATLPTSPTQHQNPSSRSPYQNMATLPKRVKLEPSCDLIPPTFFSQRRRAPRSETLPSSPEYKPEPFSRSSSSSSKSPKRKSNGKPHKERGFACAAVPKPAIELVTKDHVGPVPGIPVGFTCMMRRDFASLGVHRPPVAGICGNVTAKRVYSIVMAGGYPEDTDMGDEFLYTGAGGRDLTGNRRTNIQSFDQTLNGSNRALAMSCHAALDDINGTESDDWRLGKPIRVVRSHKIELKLRERAKLGGIRHQERLKKEVEFAPSVGYRYDGIYKVVKYWPEIGDTGHRVWRYLLRRDDEAPAPWTAKGRTFTDTHCPNYYISSDAAYRLDDMVKLGKRPYDDFSEDESLYDDDEAPAVKQERVAFVKQEEEDDDFSIIETRPIGNANAIHEGAPSPSFQLVTPPLTIQMTMNSYLRVTRRSMLFPRIAKGKGKQTAFVKSPSRTLLPKSTPTSQTQPQPQQLGAYQPPIRLLSLIRADTLNTKLWSTLLSARQQSIFKIFDYRTFVEHALTRYRLRCTLCPTFGPVQYQSGKPIKTRYASGLMFPLVADNPVTCLRCRCNFCWACVEKRCRFGGSVAWKNWVTKKLGCPNCDIVKSESNVEKTEEEEGGLVVNNNLANILREMKVPGYLSQN